MKQGETIEHAGKLWTVLGVGVTNEQGQTFLHLASQTEFIQQRNGKRPVQMADWFPTPSHTSPEVPT